MAKDTFKLIKNGETREVAYDSKQGPRGKATVKHEAPRLVYNPKADAEAKKKVEKQAKQGAPAKPDDAKVKEAKPEKKEPAAPKPKKTLKDKLCVPETILLDLTPENFVAVLKKLGGKDVGTAQMLGYFKIALDENPQHRWPRLRVMAKRLANEKPPRVVVNINMDREHRFNLP